LRISGAFWPATPIKLRRDAALLDQPTAATHRAVLLAMGETDALGRPD